MSTAERPPLIDTHAHLMDPRFEADVDQVIERAWSAGLQAVLCVGYDLESSRRAVALANTHPGVFATVGIHPNCASQSTADDMRAVERLARDDRVVGIGETGLDNYRHFSPPERQEALLLEHLRLAGDLGLPVIVHNREATQRVTELVAGWAARSVERTGVLHCFSGDRRMLDECVATGLYISFAGPLTFRNAGWLVEAAREAPLDRLVVETDSPYLAPVPVRGQRNEPAFVAHTARRLAEVRNQSYAQIAELTTRNAARLFPALQEMHNVRRGS